MRSLRPLLRLPVLALALAVSACATTGQDLSSAPTGPRAMVAAANPLAVEAGVKVLKSGGSAVDAAVAVQAVLGLVEPQSSGLGGGAFMTYYDAATKQVTAYNGRETAPAGATPDMFLTPEGKPLSYPEAVLSGRATGVPGAVAMLNLAQHDHGKLAWKDLFGDAERLADQGFIVSPRLAEMANSTRAPQASAADAVAYFTKPDGARIQAGDLLKNPAYAATLRKIAAEGPKAILEGPIAEQIVARVHDDPRPGSLSLSDMKAYAPKKGPALCRPYRVYVVCTPDAPSGGPAVLEGLGILERTAIAGHDASTAEGWYLLAEAERLMYADRDRYMGDPDFVDVPTEGQIGRAHV